MERFKNILVGVDLSEADRFVADRPAAPSRAAVDRTLWLAKANSARVLFMYVLDSSTLQVPADGQQAAEAFDDRGTRTGQAQDVLAKLVDDAARQGVAAEQRVTVGKSWIELVRQVLKGDHDLLIAGTRRLGPFRAMLFGSTGMKRAPAPSGSPDRSPNKSVRCLSRTTSNLWGIWRWNSAVGWPKAMPRNCMCFTPFTFAK